MKAEALALTWDLEPIFPGGSGSQAFRTFLDELGRDVDEVKSAFAKFPAPGEASFKEALVDVTLRVQEVAERLREAGAFAVCLVAQDTGDEEARGLQARVGQLDGQFEAAVAAYDGLLAAASEELWESFVADERIRPIAPFVEEQRRRARRKLPPEQEALIAELSVDGYHAWGELYDEVSGSMRVVDRDDDGNEVRLSMGQAQNKAFHDGDRNVRARVFRLYEDAWAESASLFASTLNHLAGYRLAVYRNRKWDSVLDEPLEVNRMRRETLDAMWQAAAEAKPLLTRYLERKAKLLGLPRLSFYDADAPLGEISTRIGYDEAAALIVRSFDRFSPEMARFAENAFRSRWIEAEDRAGKRAGGFCTSFPLADESRIFLTFDGSISTAATIAHELGHAYHQTVFGDTPYVMTFYPMNFAETASTLAEKIVADASLGAAATESERLALLDVKARDAVTFLMNIRARFLFEVSFYEERRGGAVPVERLNELMLAAQKEAYADALGEYHPLFWASKLHFYITGMPFYNFPYTFGYLFSHGVYDWAEQDPKGFTARYAALLRDTGFMPAEELAKKHLGADLTDVAFWRRSVDQALQGVRDFLAASE